MKKYFLLLLSLPSILLLHCGGVGNTSDRKPSGIISLEGVSGRIDHLAYDPAHHRVFIAELGNNTVQSVDIEKGVVLKTVAGGEEPQGILYIADKNEVVVAYGGSGEVKFLYADDLSQKEVAQAGDDADNLRLDARGTIYCGFGDGGIRIFDPQRTGVKLNVNFPGHPESFQLTKNSDTIFVNVPSKRKVLSIASNQLKTVNEFSPSAFANFPMAIDDKNHRLFIGCREPSRMEIFSTSGKKILSLDIDGDADDIFFDEASKKIYVSCGAGAIDVFEQVDANNYKLLERIKTRKGARTSLLIPGKLLLAVPASGGNGAELWIYDLY